MHPEQEGEEAQEATRRGAVMRQREGQRVPRCLQHQGS